MKKLLIIAMIALGAISLSGATVELNWDDNPAAQNITSYTVYEDVGGVLTSLGSSTTSDKTLINVVNGVHTYLVTASNDAYGEGPQSNNVSTPEAPTAPEGLQIVVIVVTP